MKKLFCFLLLSSLAFGQNFARMITGVNVQTNVLNYTFVPADATRLTAFSASAPVSALMPNPANPGFTVGTMFSVLNNGSATVTISCSGCLFFTSTSSGSSTLALTSGQGADIYSTGLGYYVQGGSGTGGGGGAVSSVFSRTGGITAVNTDYGTVGVQQVGTGALQFLKNTSGTLDVGEAYPSGGNYIHFYPDNTGGAQILFKDFSNNQISMGQGTSILGNTPGIVFASTGGNASTGSNFVLNQTDWALQFSGSGFTSNIGVDINKSLGTFFMPVNFAGTGAFQIGGSFGTNGQCLLSNGSGVVFGACSSGTVSSVGFTANQTKQGAGGTSSNPVIAITSPFNINNENIIQNANGDDAFTVSRQTDTAPTGTLFKLKTAGGSILSYFDISGNLFAPSATFTGGNAGYIGYQQGSDNCTAAIAAFSANGVCEEAPSSVGTSYTVVKAANGPSSASLKTYTALSSASTTESFTPTTGNSAHIQTADATVAGAGSGNILTTDGSGNAHNSGVNVSSILGSIQGPGSPYTNATTSGTTAYSYTNSIPAGSTVLITCVGSYKFTTAAESAEFGINFSQTPQNLFLNVEIGGNATTGTHTYGRQTSNGALITAGIAAAATGTYYPVTISGGVLTNASNASTFTIQGATSSASGTLNVDANGFTCSVK